MQIQKCHNWMKIFKCSRSIIHAISRFSFSESGKEKYLKEKERQMKEIEDLMNNFEQEQNIGRSTDELLSELQPNSYTLKSVRSKYI